MVPSKEDQRFPRSRHLRRPGEFRANRRKGTSRRCGCFIVSLSPGPGPGSRLGLTVSRKVGGAVARNRLKRRLREIFRIDAREFPDGTDVVVVALPGAALLGYDQIRKQILDGLRRIGARSRR